MIDPLREVDALRLESSRADPMRDIVAEETPVALVYNGVSHAVMMATPADLKDFAFGFSLTEGIVDHPGELDVVEIRTMAEGISIQMTIPSARFETLQARSRNLAGRVGCGLCGADTLAAAIRPIRRLPEPGGIDPAAIRVALAAVQSAQVLNTHSHGLHAAGFAMATGNVSIVREDVGRHNALDKVVGALARAGFDPASGFAVITSRASYEVVHKAASAGIGLVVAVSAPTALAIDMARKANVSLVAFARDDAMTVYTGRPPGMPTAD